MYEPLVSIIMPVYNNERYFPIAVDSIIKQFNKNIELVIIDDGSTDNTAIIADEFAEKDQRIVVIHQENQWIYQSFNNGISIANGKYIYIVNSDDILAPNAIQIIENLIYKYNYPEVIWCGMEYRFCNDNLEVHQIQDARAWSYGEKYLSVRDNPQVIMDLERGGYFSDQANIYNKDILLKCPFRNDFYGADYYNNLSIAGVINQCVVTDKVLYWHYIFDDINKNVGSKKYYGYEHYMYNEMYIKALEMLKIRGIYNKVNIDYFRTKRKKLLQLGIMRLLMDDTYKPIEERINEVLLLPYDDIISECTNNEREEFDARILNACRKYFIDNQYNIELQENFLFKMMTSLLRYEKNENDLECIKSTVYGDNNPQHIGESFYKRIISNK